MFEQCESVVFLYTHNQILFLIRNSKIHWFYTLSLSLSLSLSLYTYIYILLYCALSIFELSHRQNHMILRCFFVEIGMLITVRRGICMISWPLTLRLCVEGNLGFLRPVRISQAFLSAQESGSAADTTLSFILHVSLFVCLLNPSGQVL